MSLISEQIPVISLEKLTASSADPAAAKMRYSRLIAKFQSTFGRAPEFICRSPGRVNLIGEHIDYSGFSVLPMAIDRDMVMAVSCQPGESRLANSNDAKYPTKSFQSDPNIVIDASIHGWANYFLCGYKGVASKLNLKEMKPMQAGGLSSSSAFVCCAAVATHHANNGSLTKGSMTAAAIEGEHYAGVETGGMDQSISVMAPEGSALLIDFYPSLAATAIKLPKVTPAPVFVISNTLVVSEKALTAPTNYNLRVVETRLAAALLRKKLCNESTKKVIHLRQVQDMFGAEGDSSITKLGLMIEMVEQSFDKSPYTLEQIAKELEQTPQEVSTTFIGAIVIRADGFALYSRAMHVLTEARRVLQFQKVSSEDSPDVLKKMGELMNQSHESCRDLFQCSCPELDELRSIALESGALGCRLTGAGWGGCAVSLVPENKVKGFMGALTESYYYKHFPELKENPEQLRDALFASYPAIGAAVLNMDSK